jgi:hypothetical protein
MIFDLYVHDFPFAHWAHRWITVRFAAPLPLSVPYVSFVPQASGAPLTTLPLLSSFPQPLI